MEEDGRSDVEEKDGCGHTTLCLVERNFVLHRKSNTSSTH